MAPADDENENQVLHWGRVSLLWVCDLEQHSRSIDDDTKKMTQRSDLVRFVILPYLSGESRCDDEKLILRAQ